MAEQAKRKAVDSPGGDKSSHSSCHKSRKLNPPETHTQDITPILSLDGSKGSDITKKLVSVWVSGSNGTNSLMTQEVRESVALRESQQKCTEAESLIQKIKQRVQSAESHISDLTKALRSEEKTKADLIAKINTTAEMVTTITEHINYVTDTLDRCQRHKDHLSSLYNNIVLRKRVELGKLRDREEGFHKQMLDLQREAALLKENLRDTRISGENKLNERNARLASVVADYEVLQKQMEAIRKEKDDISRALSIKETYNLDFQKKISEYETEVNKLSNQLAEASSSIDTLKKENSQLKDDLRSKDSEMLKLNDALDSAKAYHSEQSDELSSMKNTNIELETRLNCEVNERQSLGKKLSEAIELNNELTRQVEKLKHETSMGIDEMGRRLDNAEMEKVRIREECKKITDEMEKRHKLSIETHVEEYESHVRKYESCLAEMKALEARHQSEMSRVGTSSSMAISSVNAEKSLLEEQIDSLKREKEECEKKLRQVEDLLIKHTNTEVELKRRLEKYQSESAAANVALAASAASAALNKKSQEAENQDNLRKINDLERELIKLEFSKKKSMQSQINQSQAVEETERRGKDRPARKTTAAATYQKSILKRPVAESRKSRSSPPSPLRNSNRKVNFLDADFSSDVSPVELENISNITEFLTSEDMFDKISGIRNSSSQPSQSSQIKSQNFSSQTQTSGKKFFKSRNNQPK